MRRGLYIPYFTVSRPHTREGHNLQNLTNFTNIFVFGPLNLYFPSKETGSRFPIAWPACPYAGLHIISLGSKVMADCRVTHRTSLSFFGKLTYLPTIFWMMFPSSHQPPEQLVPGVGNIATNNGRMCGKYHYSCGNALLLVRWSHGSGVLLSLSGTAPEKLATCLFSVLGEHIYVFNDVK